MDGWSTTKLSQTLLRQKAQDLHSRILGLQCLLAGIDTDATPSSSKAVSGLERPICLEDVLWTAPMKRCSQNGHPFHATCLDSWSRSTTETAPGCPCCRGTVDTQQK